MRFSAKVFVCAFLLALVAMPAVVRADLADGYAMQSYAVGVEGQFTAYDNQLHYWLATTGYHVYDVMAGTTTTIGLPPDGTFTNSAGDPFGVLDPVNDVFYAGTYYSGGDSYVYGYDRTAGTWSTEVPETQAGVHMINAYGGQVHNGQLYVAGLAEPWNGGYGQANFIFGFDHAAIPGGDAPRHDTLIETAGNSAHVAVAPNSDVYYGTFSDNTLYHWTASQIAGVTNDLYADEEDTFLTLADGEAVLTMPGGGNGMAVDEGGNVFFAVNNFTSESNHVLAMVDPSEPAGYREIYTTDGYMDWFGPISVDGDFLNGGTLYFSPVWGGGGSLLGIQQVPEPGSFVLLASALALALVARRRRRS